jgi:hypothetical protein
LIQTFIYHIFYQVHLFIKNKGGSFGKLIQPIGLHGNYFWGGSYHNEGKGFMGFLGTQGMYCSSINSDINVDDFVFYTPWEGDNILFFKNLIPFREFNNFTFYDFWETYRDGS